MKKNKPIKKSQAKSSEKSIEKKEMQASKMSSTPNVVPLGSRILIRPFTKEELEKKNSFGIILPGSDSKEKSEQGIVLAVGPGEYRDGVFVASSLQVGQKVCFSKYGYDDITVDGEEFYLIKEENVIAILK